MLVPRIVRGTHISPNERRPIGPNHPGHCPDSPIPRVRHLRWWGGGRGCRARALSRTFRPIKASRPDFGHARHQRSLITSDACRACAPAGTTAQSLAPCSAQCLFRPCAGLETIPAWGRDLQFFAPGDVIGSARCLAASLRPTASPVPRARQRPWWTKRRSCAGTRPCSWPASTSPALRSVRSGCASGRRPGTNDGRWWRG